MESPVINGVWFISNYGKLNLIKTAIITELTICYVSRFIIWYIFLVCKKLYDTEVTLCGVLSK